jgi:glycine/D-amino acid oxidase-like deaminating enzyme
MFVLSGSVDQVWQRSRRPSVKPGVWVVGGYCGHGNVTGSGYARAAVRSAEKGEKESLL